MASANSKHDMLRSLSPLAEQFTDAYSELAAIQPAYDAAADRREREISRRVGFRTDCVFRSEAEASIYIEEMGRVDEETRFGEIQEGVERAYEKLDTIVRAISEVCARDLRDLALKANALASARPELWSDPADDLGYDDMLLRNLIENICALAAVPLMAKSMARPSREVN